MLSTRIIPIEVSPEDRPLLTDLVRRGSIASHKLQKDFVLAEDESLAEEIKAKYNLAAKHIEYLQIDAVGAGKAWLAGEKTLVKQLEELQARLAKQTKPKKRERLEKKILAKKRAMNRPPTFGGRHRLQMLAKGTSNDPVGLLQEYRRARTAPLFFQGEASYKGSRFLDLKDMADGKVMLKYTRSFHIPISFRVKNDRERELFSRLAAMAQERIMPIAVRLSADAIVFSYDDQLLQGRNLQPSKAFYKKVKARALPEDESKALKAAEFRRLQANLLIREKKIPNRYAAIDLNPNGVGFVVADKLPNGGMNVIDKSFFDLDALLKKKISFAKRKYENSILFKQIFLLLAHYRCAHLICEDLELKNKDLGNKTANRKTNNHWLRGKAKEQIQKRVVQNGMLLIEVNPAYSSFIGNILHEEYDPIAAAMELARRGMKKYETGGFCPDFSCEAVINGLGSFHLFARMDERMREKMYDEVRACESWMGLWGLFSMRKWSVRRRREEFLFLDQPLSGRRSLMRALRPASGRDISVLVG
jgi:hypothetical protein